MFVYSINIQPENINKYNYGEKKDVEFSCPIHRGDYIEIDNTELEVYHICHEVGGKSWLYVKWDRYKAF